MIDSPMDHNPTPPESSPTQISPQSRAKSARARASAAVDLPGSSFGISPDGTSASDATSGASERGGSRRVVVPVVAALVVGAVIGGASGAGIAVLLNHDSSAPASSAQQDVVINNAAAVNDVTAVAVKASPSVVTISVTSSQAAGSGSGVVISTDGYIVTNNHVVTLDGVTNQATWQVEDNQGRLYDAKLVGTDPTVDLAVLKVDGQTEWTPIEWADSSKLNVGDVTIAMGAPLGLAGTVTTGIVSALHRSIQIGSSAVPDQQVAPDQQSSPFDFWNFDYGQGQPQQSATQSSISVPVIQTDAAINPGNSGGALLDTAGRLIGINVAIASAGSSGSSGNIGVGFALPSNLAKRVSSEIIASGRATHGMLGASVGDAAAEKGSTQVGAIVRSIVSGGAADQAGLKEGDIVTSFNGVPIATSSDLTAQVRTLAAGSTADVVIVRGGKTQTITVTLGEFK